MDKELEDAQNLTKEDLLKKLESGRPADLARPKPVRLTGFTHVSFTGTWFEDGVERARQAVVKVGA